MIFGFPCCCDDDCGDHVVPEYTNTTQVDNYTSGPALIAPYSRPWFVSDGSGGCLPASSTICGEADQPKCYTHGFDGVPVDGLDISGITPGGDVTVDLNGYEATAGTVTISNPCYGWKAVAARAVWPGRFGFINSGTGCCPDGSETETKVQTKYTSITTVVHGRFESTYTVPQCAGPDLVSTVLLEIDYSQTASVDEYGNLTRSGSVSVNFSSTGDPTITSCIVGDNPGARFAGSAAGNFGDMDGMNVPRDLMPLDANCGIISVGTPGADPLDFPNHTGTATELNALEIFTLLNNSGATEYSCGEETPRAVTYDFDAESSPAVFSLSDSVLSVEWGGGVTVTAPVCCDGEFVEDVFATQVTTVEYSHTVTLGGSRTYASVKADAETLLDEWPLTNDAVYPWRTDASTWLVPFVKRDAASTVPEIDWGVVGGEGEDACNFVSVTPYSGDILGAPNPAGYDRHYNFRHIVWQADCNGDGSIQGNCQMSLGELGASPLPATATKWTDKGTDEGPQMRGPGGWMTNFHAAQYSDVEDSVEDGILVQKWAETIMDWPHVNYARPCGRDRYLFDETAIACIVDFTAPDLEIEADPLSGPTEFEVGDVIAINTEVYQIATKTDAQNYTVGSKLYDLLISCDGASKLRFPAARGICGELNITDAVQTSPGVVTITVDRPHWLKRNGSSSDTVNFTDVAGLGSGLTATVTGDDTFTVPGTLGAWTSGGTVSQTGAQTAWDTTCPRKTYFTREWQSRFREYDEEDPEDLNYTVSEVQRSYTNTSLTRPYAVVISPNSDDTPAHGVRYDFGDIDHDQCFGESWHMDVVQAMADPYWQADHVPCDHGGGAWEQASEPCGDDANHYDYPPLVEGVLDLPVGAPTLPDGVILYDEGAHGIPGAVGHPNCIETPYDRGTVHAIRAAWEVCDAWPVKIGHHCDSFPYPSP
jgi:hypothetical protein